MIRIDKRKLFGTIIGFIIFFILMTGISYAMYKWKSEDTIFTININDSYFYCESGLDINANGLSPILDYRNGPYHTFKVNNIGRKTTNFSLSLNISEISDSLINESFKYKLVVDKTGGNNDCADTSTTECESVAEGDFSKAEVGMNTLVQSVSLPNDVRYQYYLFTYIDGNMENDASMQSGTMTSILDVCETVVYLDYNGGNIYNNIEFLKVVTTYAGLPELPTKNNSTVTYNTNGGNSIDNGSVSYEFNGWYLEDDEFKTKVTSSSLLSDRNTEEEEKITNHTLYAKWNPTSITLPTPTKTGYTFQGWYSDSNLTNKVGDAGASYTPSRETEGNITLYAKWAVNKIYVQFSMNGGTWQGSSNTNLSYNGEYITLNGSKTVVTYPYGQTGIDLANWDNSSYINISKTGYTAKEGAEWNLKTDGTGTSFTDSSASVNANDLCDASAGDCTATLYVNWVGNSYTVTADSESGTIPTTSGWTVASDSKTATKSVTYGSTYGTLPTPTKTGYNFQGWSLVPEEYQQVDYIQSSGGPYIATGVVGTARWEFDIQFTDLTTRQLMGYGGSGSEYWGVQTDGNYGLATWNYMNVQAGNRDKIIHNYGENGLYYLNVNGTSLGTGVTDVSSKEYGLFNLGASGGYAVKAKLYEVKTIQNGVLVRHMVPCYRKSDNVVGLYDIVNNKFYTNSGSSSFSKGSNIYITSSSKVSVAGAHKIYANWKDTTGPTISSVTASTAYDVRNSVSFTATDSGSGINGYNITTSTTAPTTWIPLISSVETTTETKYAYNAAWARVFHHNTHYGTVLYSNATEAKSSSTTDKYSVLGNMANYANSSGVYEMLLEYPGVSGYNRWKQTSNPATTSESVTGYSAVNVSWTGNYWAGLALSNSGATFIDGSINHGNWYYAIGSYSAWGGAIPGPASKISHVNLWNRIDDKTTTTTTSAVTRTIGDISSNGTYYVWVKDSIGNTSYKSVTINKVDTTAPTATITASSATKATLSSSDNVGVTKYYWGTSDPENTNVTWSTSLSTTTPTISAAGTYYLGLQDAAGNIGKSSIAAYSITYNGNSSACGGGTVSSVPSTQYKLNGTTATISSNTPTCSGYTFTGWNTAADGSGTSIDKGGTYTSNASATLYAQWGADTTGPTYSSYEIKNITTSGYDVYIYGVSDPSGVDRAQFPTWTSYNGQDDIQSSWGTNSSASGTNQGSGTYYYRVNTTDHNGEAGTYTTHIYLYDSLGNTTGIGISSVTVPGITVTLSPNNTSYGSLSATSVSVGYGAKYTTSGSTITFPGGQTVTATPKTITGYTTTFSSWSSSSGTITAATTITANFSSSANKVYVQFSMNGGAWASSTNTNLSYSGNYVTLNGSTTVATYSYGQTGIDLANWDNSGYINISKTGYIAKTGAEWNLKSDGTGTSFTDSSASVNANDLCNASSGNCTATLYVNWTPKVITVTFNKNDGSGSTASQTFTYGASGNKFGYNTDGTPKWSQTGQFGQWDRTGYTLLGWALSSSATTNNYSTYSGVSDSWINSNYPSITLYAVWKDQTAPTLNVTNTVNGSTYSGAWTNQTITSTITFSDSGSGINASSLAWGTDGSTWTTLSNTSTSTFTDTWSAEGSRTGWYRICDNAGNCSTKSFDVKIDKTAPSKATITATSVTNVTLSYADNNGVVAYYFGTSNPSSTTVSYTSITQATSGTISKTITSAGTYYFAAKDVAGNITVSSSITAYQITYNANGGTGAPSSQIKLYGQNLTLSSTIPTKTGFTFLGWSTSSTATTATYSSGATYSTNASTTLYAVWNTPLLSSYVKSLYNDGSSINTVNIGGDSSNPTVSLNSTQGVQLDNNGIYRYYGSDPNNYVSFNGELWRIIGVENVKSGIDTSEETRVKIIKSDALTDDNGLNRFSWDSSDSTINTGLGVSDWNQADLMTELNNLYLNRKSGTCYTGKENATTACNFTNKGLSEEARMMIKQAEYYLGGDDTLTDIWAHDYYTFERGKEVYDCSTDDGACPRYLKWTGNVGIMYPSDYMYATDLSVCKSGGYSYTDNSCKTNDWLLYQNYEQWNISPGLSKDEAFTISSSGYVFSLAALTYYSKAVRPTVYLRSEVVVTSGTGTNSNPYQIKLGSTTTDSTLMGDANDDGMISRADIDLLFDYILGNSVTINLEASDLNNDGKISAADTSKLGDYLLGNYDY